MDQIQIITFATGVLSTFIGTGFGAWFIVQRQDARSRRPRKLMLEVLRGLKKYKTYHDAESEFNSRSVIEKKAIIIAMKNLGIPLKIDVINDSYNLNKVQFDKEPIEDKSIDQMIGFVKNGLCNDLFFKEIGDDLYNAPPKIIFARNLALRFLDALDPQQGAAKITHVLAKANINLNQYQIIQVFFYTVELFDYTGIAPEKMTEYLESASVSSEKIKLAKENVKNGVFDNLFYWDDRAYKNMNSQRNLAETVLSSLVKNNSAANAEATTTDTTTSS